MIDPRTHAWFSSTPPMHSTCWLTVAYPEGYEPTEIWTALNTIGWAKDPRFRDAPPMEEIDWDTPDPATGSSYTYLGYKMVEVTLEGPKGSGLFGEWDQTLKRDEMRNVRAALRKHGIKVPYHKKTLQEML